MILVQRAQILDLESAMLQSPSADRQFYDRISQSYDLIADSNEHAAREAGLELLAIQPGERVLEVGFGTGQSLCGIARSVGESGHVEGVDISQGMYNVATERLRREGLNSRVTLHVAEVPPLSFDDASFDAVTMSFTLELFPLEQIPKVLSECHRVLRPAGRLGVVSMAVVDRGQTESTLERTYKWMHQHFPHIVDCQPIDALGFVTQAGFNVRKHQTVEIWTMPVAILVADK